MPSRDFINFKSCMCNCANGLSHVNRSRALKGDYFTVSNAPKEIPCVCASGAYKVENTCFQKSIEHWVSSREVGHITWSAEALSSQKELALLNQLISRH